MYRQITTEQGDSKAKEYEVLFTEVSAKSGTGVASLFQTLATHLTGNEPNNTSEIPLDNIIPSARGIYKICLNAYQYLIGVVITPQQTIAKNTGGNNCEC